VLQCVAVCYSVLQCVEVCFSINGVLQCIMNMVCCGLLKKRFVRWTRVGVLQYNCCVAVCYKYGVLRVIEKKRVCVLQDEWGVAVCYIYSALQCDEKETSSLDYRVSVLQDKKR